MDAIGSPGPADRRVLIGHVSQIGACGGSDRDDDGDMGCFELALGTAALWKCRTGSSGG